MWATLKKWWWGLCNFHRAKDLYNHLRMQGDILGNLVSQQDKLSMEVTSLRRAIPRLDALIERVGSLERATMRTLAADVPVHRDSGFFVVMIRIGKRDYVEIVPLRPNITLEEFTTLKKELRLFYGLNQKWQDGPMPVVRFLEDLEGRQT